MKQEPNRRSVVSHIGVYAAGNLLLLAAGFVTFPITTRALSAADFGILGYWEVWSLFVVATCKLGCSELIVRFYPHGGSHEEQVRYGTNFVAAPLFISTFLWSVAFGICAILVETGHVRDGRVALLALLLALFQIWTALGSARLAAGELSTLNMSSSIGQRWLTVLATAVVLLQFMPSPEGALVARLGPCLLVVGWLLSWMRKHQPFSRRSLDLQQIREGLSFSTPLALKEISHIVLVLGNRVMLRWLVGSDSVVGVFTVGFSLAMYLEQILNSALTTAITPTMSRLYKSGGASAVHALKAKVLVPLTHLAFLGAALIYCRGEDAIVFMSGAARIAASPVFVLAGICYLAQGVTNVMGAGLLLEKRTRRIFGLTAAAAVFNLALNFFLIPRFGIVGAATATCGSQLLLQVAIYFSCSADLRCSPAPRTLALGLVLSVCLVLCAKSLDAATGASLAGRMLLTGVAAVLIYALPASLIEPALRKELFGLAARLRR